MLVRNLIAVISFLLLAQLASGSVSREKEALGAFIQAQENRQAELLGLSQDEEAYLYKHDIAQEKLNVDMQRLTDAQIHLEQNKLKLEQQNTKANQRAVKLAEYSLEMAKRSFRIREKSVNRIQKSLAELEAEKVELVSRIDQGNQRIEQQKQRINIAEKKAKEKKVSKKKAPVKKVVSKKSIKPIKQVKPQPVVTSAPSVTKAGAAPEEGQDPLTQELLAYVKREVTRLEKVLKAGRPGKPSYKRLKLAGSQINTQVFEFLGKDQYRVKAKVSAGEQVFKIAGRKYQRTIPAADDGEDYVFLFDARRSTRPRLVMFRKAYLDQI
ncbi:hypothetical protein [Parendozoicomonas sp. Alg238-R29]|uniref:hypothetical protein n=1 Tax=Parendozoicomonas sp. Alg238-R29 TaxID=2993446 RepID=UPI00248E425D|nr:hypothetical protein [Parendozoicomonas sp. Alg238-R29]